MEKRIESLDIAKCLGILAVIILHTIVYKPIAAVTALIMGSTMLFFFMVTGYNYKSGRDLKTNIVKRAKRLLIPFVIYSVIINIICGLIFFFSDGLGIDVIMNNIKEFYFGIIGFVKGEAPENLLSSILPFWFLIIMFLASVIFFPIADFALKSGKRITIISIAMLLITALSVEFLKVQLPWHIEITPAFVAILLIGAYAGKKQALTKLKEIKGWKRIAIILLSVILLVATSIFCGSAQLVSSNKWGNLGGVSVFISVIQAIIQAVMLVLVSEMISETKKLKKPFVWIGENVMQFYIMHAFVGFILIKITNWPMLMFTRVTSSNSTEINQSVVLFGLILLFTALWTYIENIIKMKYASIKKCKK